MISISIPPFPDFIEGNYKIMRKGQSHVERKNLGFFDLIAVKKGALFLAEGEKQYEVKENEMFILLPDRHHYSWKPCHGSHARRRPGFTGCIFIQQHSGNKDRRRAVLYQSFRYQDNIIISVRILCICKNIRLLRSRNCCLNCFRIYWTVRQGNMISGKQKNYF